MFVKDESGNLMWLTSTEYEYIQKIRLLTSEQMKELFELIKECEEEQKRERGEILTS